MHDQKLLQFPPQKKLENHMFWQSLNGIFNIFHLKKFWFENYFDFYLFGNVLKDNPLEEVFKSLQIINFYMFKIWPYF
jgi:hypothetical protein